jgi:hypothetical protein
MLEYAPDAVSVSVRAMEHASLEYSEALGGCLEKERLIRSPVMVAASTTGGNPIMYPVS